MQSILRTLMGDPPVEYIALDEHLHIVQFSKRAQHYADDPLRIRVGEDIRWAFPEFAGSEPELYQMATSHQGKWQLRGVVRNTGNAFTIDVLVQPAPLESNERLIVLIEDVTERYAVTQRLIQQSNEGKLLLNAVAATRDHYEHIIESISDGLLVFMPNGSLRTANASASRILGFHKAELTGMQVRDILDLDMGLLEREPLRDFETTASAKHRIKVPVLVSSSVMESNEASPRQILVLIRDLREKFRAEKRISKLETEKAYLLEETSRDFCEIIGSSSLMNNLYKQIEQVATTDSTVLLQGETGTGKELVARAIHRLSIRKDNLLVKINCAALPSELVESELFGYEKGAFTGANARRIGRFEYAHGGTVLLDEVAELPLGTQAKLLRILQERQFERVGSSQTHSVDVRIIAASNTNLSDAVELGTFRSDLFYRLNVFPILIPPLRERKEDIPALAMHFANVFALRMNKKVGSLDKQSLEHLMQYDWPGNVRELSSIIERAVILTHSQVLQIDAINRGTIRTAKSPDGTLEEVERMHIIHMLKEADGIIEGPRGAALQLGINPSTLRSRMRKLGIHRRGSSYE